MGRKFWNNTKVNLLIHYCNETDLTYAKIAEKMGVHVNTVFNKAHELISQGYINRKDKEVIASAQSSSSEERKRRKALRAYYNKKARSYE